MKPPATCRPVATTSGMALSHRSTRSVPVTAATAAVGMATRRPWSESALKCIISMPLKLAFAANRSAWCWKNTAMVRTKMVSTWPAAARGTAMAMPVLTSWWPAMTTTDATVDASAASGAMAAPTFIQPRAMSSSAPPRMTPVVKSPMTSPMRVQATSGR